MTWFCLSALPRRTTIMLPAGGRRWSTTASKSVSISATAPSRRCHLTDSVVRASQQSSKYGGRRHLFNNRTVMPSKKVKPALFSNGSSNSSRRACNRKVFQSTMGAEEAAAAEVVEQPTRQQLWRVFMHAAVPMIGFGFTDNTVMIQAGNAVDCTLGVTFGLSTLAAAAIGQIFSDASGVIFGSTLERMATACGLPSANLTSAQRSLPIVKRVVFTGSLLGIIFGCLLGCVNLLFLDTSRSSVLKLQAFNEEQEFDFTIEASNAQRPNATALTVTGPDVDGLLASMTAALAVRGASIIEIHAQRAHPNDETDSSINDVFYVVKRETGEAFDDDELEDLAEGLLDSTRTPMNVNSVKAAQHELEQTNAFLQARVKKLEKLMYEKQITLVSSSGESRRPSSET